jgi:hypothetical protein
MLILAGSDELRKATESLGVPSLSILRLPCAVEEIVDAARALVGVPWTDHRKGA